MKKKDKSQSPFPVPFLCWVYIAFVLFPNKKLIFLLRLDKSFVQLTVNAAA